MGNAESTLPSLAVVVGATGTGKSALSLGIAAALRRDHGVGAEVVNADAMQLYRGMDIGTAKIAREERLGVRHHMLDVLDVTQESSVSDYQADARAVIDGILNRGNVPILVGGSGLYVSSVIFDFRFPGRDPHIRARLEAELAQTGPGMLYQRLRAVDPQAAGAIGPHNGRRIVRALEVVELTGQPFGSGLPDDNTLWKSGTRIVGLRAPRDELVARLDARVRSMWDAGLVEEVRSLLPLGLERGVTASRAIGYSQAIAQLRDELTQAEAMELSAALTRKYARRQVSWFKRYPNVSWLDYDNPARVEHAIAQLTLTHA